MDFSAPETQLWLAKVSLLALLTVIAVVFALAWWMSLRRKAAEGWQPSLIQLVIGFITDFFAGVLAEQQPDPKKLQQAHGERLDQYKKEQAQE